MKPLLFVHIPKTAGTFIILSLGNQIGMRSTHHYPKTHPKTKEIITMQLNVRSQIPKLENYYSFTVVRHPYTRFLSAYHYLLRGGNQTGLDLEYQSILSSYPTVDDVINDLYNLKKRIVHFVDQYVFVYLYDKSKIMHKYEGFEEEIDEEYFEYDDENILVDRVIKFENLHTELPTVLPFYFPEETEKSKTSDVVLNESQKDKIANLYLKDFLLFDYYP
jgi:hypothetical protein